MNTTTYTIRDRVVKTTWRLSDDEDLHSILTALTIDGTAYPVGDEVNYIFKNHEDGSPDAAALPCIPGYGDMDDDNARGVVGYGDLDAVKRDFADMCLATVEAFETWKKTGKVARFYTPPRATTQPVTT